MVNRNPYREFVEGYVRLLQQGRALKAAPVELPATRPPLPTAPKLLLFSPLKKNKKIWNDEQNNLENRAGQTPSVQWLPQTDK